MNEQISLIDIGESADYTHTQLVQLLDAMHLLDDMFEDEGYQPENEFNETRALFFVRRRFPMHLALYRIIHSKIAQAADEMKQIATLIYEESERQKRSVEA